MNGYIYKIIPSHPQFEICDKAPMEFCLRTVNTKEYLKVYINGQGYPQCRLGKKYGDDGKHYFIHNLVAEAYLGECPEGYDVDHRSTDKKQNNIENLHYVSRKQNLNNPITKINRIVGNIIRKLIFRKNKNDMKIIIIDNELIEMGVLTDLCNKYGFLKLKSDKYPVIDSISSYVDDKYRVLENIKNNEYCWKVYSFEDLPKEIIDELANENCLWDNIDRMNDYLLGE